MSSTIEASRTARNIDILIIEDDATTASGMAKVLARNGYVTEYRLNLQEALTAVDQHSPRLVLLDLSLPDGSGLSELVELKRRGVQEVIVVSGTDNPEHTRQCLAAGAFDFISKPADAAEVVRSVRRADVQLRLEQLAQGAYPSVIKPGFGSLEGVSVASEELFRKVRAVARSLPGGGCLITGPAGALKADIAASVQSCTPDDGVAYLINCAGENDVCALLRFKGGQQVVCSSAVTGENTDDRVVAIAEGYLQKAQNGSLVLDDLSALRMDVQIMLSQYLEENKITPVNSIEPQPCQCSIIGILREEADTAIEEGRLHAALYDALAANCIEVPGLQTRSDDIEFFARKAVQQLNEVFGTEKSLSVEFLEELGAYAWPGNLIEFRNLVLMAYRLTEPGEELAGADLLFSKAEPVVNSQIAPFIGMSLREAERVLVEATLDQYGNNKRKVADVLGVSVKTLYNRLKSYSEPEEQDTVLKPNHAGLGSLYDTRGPRVRAFNPDWRRRR